MADYGPYFAIVRDVHDGDTIGLDIDLGFKHEILTRNVLTGNRQFTCRLWGINAPELNTTAGKTSAAYLQQLLPVGTRVTVISKDWDAYQGRYDAVVTLIGQTVSVNDTMVAAGMAVNKTY